MMLAWPPGRGMQPPRMYRERVLREGCLQLIPYGWTGACRKPCRRVFPAVLKIQRGECCCMMLVRMPIHKDAQRVCVSVRRLTFQLAWLRRYPKAGWVINLSCL
eukprot:4469671-Amphidinium_carterae.1